MPQFFEFAAGTRQRIWMGPQFVSDRQGCMNDAAGLEMGGWFLWLRRILGVTDYRGRFRGTAHVPIPCQGKGGKEERENQIMVKYIK